MCSTVLQTTEVFPLVFGVFKYRILHFQWAIDLHISYENRQISRIHSTKFLGLVTDDKLSWHYHIDQMIPKLNKATYVIRILKPLLSLEALKMVYFVTVHSIISYGIIFWGISTYSKIIFKTQKKNS
jgi:hypothetical protein